MYQNYFKIAFRNLLRHKGFSFINIFGLAVGMACSLLIFLYVKDETGYDKFHADAQNIHRVVKDFINDDGSRIPDATTPAALAPALQREVPEIKHVTRIFPTWGGTWLVKYGDKKITEDKLWRVDSSFFDGFTFHFIRGNAATALPNPSSLVITESVARRYFGKEDPIGKTLNFSPGGDMKVTAVIKDVPSNSHFHFDLLASWRQLPLSLDENWGGYNYYTYIKLKEGADTKSLAKKIQGVYERAQEERFSVFYTQPLTDIHLGSKLKWELEPNSDKIYVYIFSIIGFFILLIAAINYINLSTAKSSLRAKEIGIRKVSGAVRPALVRQFLLESVITTVVAGIVALFLAELLVATVNEITLKSLSVLENPLLIAYMLVAAVLVGVLAGIFPALYLSSFQPVIVLKGLKLNERGALSLRKILVVVQFTISIALIIGALIIIRQVNYIKSANLGIDKEQVVVIKNAGALSRSDRTAYLNTIRQFPGVIKASGSSNVIGEGFSTSRLSQKGSDKEQQLNFSMVGFDYLDVIGIKIKQGRGFTSAFPADTMNNGIPGGPLEQTIGGIVLNETAVKELNLAEPVLGKQLLWGSDGDTSYYVGVIGVAEDFHFTSLRNEIKPYGFISIPNNQFNLVIKLSTSNLESTLAQLKTKWTSFNTERPFEYTFLDETFDKLYQSETRFQKLFITLVVIGIVIACLGLLGLATYAAQQRVREIGIRKTLGASVTSIVTLLSGDFLRLVLIALLFAIPISWYAMNKWLQDFAYRIGIDWWIFAVAGLAAVVIAFFTISIQTVKAATANPVQSLRNE